MSWRTLDEGTARMHGAANAEDVIQILCADCADGNLDFTEPEFCPIQAAYGFDGEHAAIQYNDETAELRCDAWTEADHIRKAVEK